MWVCGWVELCGGGCRGWPVVLGRLGRCDELAGSRSGGRASGVVGFVVEQRERVGGSVLVAVGGVTVR